MNSENGAQKPGGQLDNHQADGARVTTRSYAERKDEKLPHGEESWRRIEDGVVGHRTMVWNNGINSGAFDEHVKHGFALVMASGLNVMNNRHLFMNSISMNGHADKTHKDGRRGMDIRQWHEQVRRNMNVNRRRVAFYEHIYE